MAGAFAFAGNVEQVICRQRCRRRHRHCLCRRQHSPRPSRSRSCQKFRSLVSIRSRPWLDAIDPAVPKRLEDWLAARELPTIKTAVVEAALGQFLDRQPAPPQAPPPRRR